MIEETMTRPVIRQTTTVSQKTPVEPTRAGLTALAATEAAEACGAEPIPASLENRPLAIPARAAEMMLLPTKPPAAALKVKADEMIKEIVAGM